MDLNYSERELPFVRKLTNQMATDYILVMEKKIIGIYNETKWTTSWNDNYAADVRKENSWGNLLFFKFIT